MKKLTVFVLALLMLFTVAAMSSCGDPLEKKVEELNTAYNEFGDAFYNAVKNCSFNNVYDSAELSPKFSEWSALLKEAKTTTRNYSEYDEAGLDEFITKWKTATDELNSLAAQYPIPTNLETETSAETD